MNWAPHPRRDGQLLYEWLEANFRYFTADDQPAAPKGSSSKAWGAKVIPTLDVLLNELDSSDHERVLRYATGEPFGDELGPVMDECRCRWCEQAYERREQERQVPRRQRVRDALLQTLADHFQHPKRERSRASHSPFGYGYLRAAVRIEEPIILADEFPRPAVNPAFKKSFAPLRFFFGTEERLGVYMKVVPPAWPLLSNLLGPPPTGEDREYPADVLKCVRAVAAHISYASPASVSLQRTFLEWTWGTPKLRSTHWTCRAEDCDLSRPLPRTSPDIPDDWIHHKFGHALMQLLLDALRHKCPVNRGLGMPLINGLSGNVYVKKIIVGNPYVYWPS